MDNTLLIVGDSDALISTFHKDANHEATKEILKKLSSLNAEIVFPSAIIAEAITTTRQSRFNDPHLSGLVVKQLTSELITTVPTDNEILLIAASLFNPDGSKKNTFFDAIVAATAKKYEATVIFSFDSWYTKLGFQLVEEFAK